VDTGTVVNLSNRPLTDSETNLLSLGLSFCPTNKPATKTELHAEYLEFDRKVRLNHYFKKQRDYQKESESEPESDKEDTGTTTKRKKKGNTGWTPPHGLNTHLDLYLNLTSKELSEHIPRPKQRHNLPPRLRAALRRLKDDQNIIIKPADKGGATVILNKDDYVSEANRQLTRPDHYRKLPKDFTPKINKHIIKTIKDEINKGNIQSDLLEDLINRQPRTPIFYLLPKIHKQNNPGRPIISNTNSPTEPISKYLDSLLRPAVMKTKSFIKDTGHLLELLENMDLPMDSILCTIDVSALYTNIPHDEGIEACLRALRRTRNIPPKETLKKLMEIVLTSNCFEFNEQFYEQVQGTAMGTAMAPNYANLFMDSFERRFLSTQTYKPLLWLRFIDDILMIWPHDSVLLDQLLEDINQFHQTIKFTSEISTTHVNFLDLTIMKIDNRLETKSYHKPTDAHTYLHYSSCHPTSQKTSIPYSQFLRMKRNSTLETDAEDSIRKLRQAFNKRGYPNEILEKNYQKVKEKTQESILHNSSPKETKQENIIYVTTYNPTSPKIKETITKHIEVLKDHPQTSHLKSENLTVAFKRPKNLRDILVHSRMNNPYQENGLFKCNKKGCSLCPFVADSNKFNDSHGNKTYQTKGHFTCNSDHVIYILECKKCKKAYVGQTSKTIRERIYRHTYDIRRGILNNTAVSRHFNQPDHNINLVSIKIICSGSRNIVTRLANEESWIKTLMTYHPDGINVQS
jgi:hypothetical protein